MMCKIKFLFLQSIILIYVSKVCGKNNLHRTESGLDARGISVNDGRRHLLSLTMGKKESGKKTMSGKGDKTTIFEEEADSIDSDALAKKQHSSGSEDVPKTSQYIEKASNFKTQKSRSSSKEATKQRKSRSTRSRVMEVIQKTDSPSFTPLEIQSPSFIPLLDAETDTSLDDIPEKTFPEENESPSMDEIPEKTFPEKNASPSIDEIPGNAFPEENASPSIDEPTVMNITSAPSITQTAQTLAPTGTPLFVGREVEAGAMYEFQEGANVSEPNSAEIIRLQVATSAFYIGVFREFYENNTNTTFSRIVARIQDVTYSPDADPPIQIEWAFELTFSEDSTVIPSDEEILDIINSDQETLDQFVANYLDNGNDLWTLVTAVTFEEQQPVLPAEVTATAVPSSRLPEEPNNFLRADLETTFMFQFESDANVAEPPSEEDYDKLASAVGLYLTGMLTQEFLNSAETTLATVVAAISGTFYAENEPLQMNFDFHIFFSPDSSVIPDADAIFEIIKSKEASLDTFINNFDWNEGDIIWNEVSSVTVQPPTPIQRRKRKKGGG